jgi:hypothetical protein
MQWAMGADIVARPLRAIERRRFHPTRNVWVIGNRETKGVVPEVSPTWRPALLMMHMDQCSVGRTVIHFAQFVMLLLLEAIYDPYHLLWNALKRGIGKTIGKYWRSMILLHTRCNINLGPWRSRENRTKREDALRYLAETSSPRSAWFQDNLQEFAFDVGLPSAPRSEEEQQTLYRALIGKSVAITQVGKETSLNRWFSITRGIQIHDPEWTLERETAIHDTEAKLRRKLTEEETRLIWPTKDPKKNDAAAVKQLRAAPGNQDRVGYTTHMYIYIYIHTWVLFGGTIAYMSWGLCVVLFKV